MRSQIWFKHVGVSGERVLEGGAGQDMESFDYKAKVFTHDLVGNKELWTVVV